tara:strand:+ start:7522 stop:9327 length:1806 start_codon:yes stop_codon:yes gene_type:complete
MKKLLILLFIPISILGQEEKAEMKTIVSKFTKAYNSEDYESVFMLFSPKMKKSLPINELTDFLQNLYSGAGKILEKEFLREEDNISIYKLSFENWVAQYNFSINKEKQINDVFYFIPFEEEIFSKKAINNISSKEKIISKGQAELIFEKSKYFPNNTQLALAFINGKNVNYFGIKRENDSIININNSKHIFEIGSITKVFTANLLAQAVIKNKLKLNHNINDYLEIKLQNETPISFKSLANHTSGLPRMPGNFSVEKLDSANVMKVRHILIPYKGALAIKGDVEYTKDSAKKIADSIIKEIVANNKKFELFLKFSSDIDVSNELGEIEFTFFDGFESEFRDFCFDNDVGSIDIVETVYGYHIIEILSKGDDKRLVNLRNLSENPYKYYDNIDLENYLTNQLEIDKKAIGSPIYSNLGYGVLGYTLSKIYGSDYENLVQKFIFSKHEMNNSFFNADSVDDRLVRGLNDKGNVTANWDFSVMISAGGILSNTEDLAKYAVAHFDKSNTDLNLIKEKTIKLNKQVDIGLGWHIINSEKTENKWFWHNGGTGGYTSSMAIDVENKVGVVILSNVSAASSQMGNIDQLCFELMKTLKDVNGELIYK